jgi:tetratricopeptide (TPR) repeat protein
MMNGNDLYSQILEHGPSSGTLYVVLSKLKQEGEWKRIVQACVKALKIHPQDIAIRQLLAEAYLETGFLSQAEAEWEQVTKQMDDLASAYKHLATLYHRGKREEEASKALHVYLAHRPDDQEAQQLLQGLKTLPEAPPVEAEPSVEPAAPVPEDAGPEAGEEVAEEAVDTALPPEQEDVPEIATTTLAELYYAQGQIDEAIRTYERVLAENPDHAQARARLEELKAPTPPEPVVQRDTERERKEKMIALLEKWLSNFQEGMKDTLPA